MEEIKFNPLSNYVLIDIVYKDTTTGGIVLPDSVKKTLNQIVSDCTVVKLSIDTDNEGRPMVRTVKVGDKVLFDPNYGRMINVYGKEYALMRETDIIGILTGNEEDYAKSIKPDIKIFGAIN